MWIALLPDPACLGLDVPQVGCTLTVRGNEGGRIVTRAPQRRPDRYPTPADASRWTTMTLSAGDLEPAWILRCRT